MNKVTQHERILGYVMNHGSITPMEAFRELSITKLSTRIGEMRRAGIAFVKTRVDSENKFGEPVHYMQYSLVRTDLVNKIKQVADEVLQ